jgi:hypothetical protein
MTHFESTSEPRSIPPAYATTLGVLAVIGVAIAIFDGTYLGPGNGGNFIALDFRGLLIVTYAVWLSTFALVSTAAALIRKPSRILPWNMAASFIACAVTAASFRWNDEMEVWFDGWAWFLDTYLG